MRVNIPILIAWPTVRIVATAADAADVSFGGTELIITFVFGGENNPKPKPKIIMDIIRNTSDDPSFRSENMNIETAPMPIPMAASI